LKPARPSLLLFLVLALLIFLVWLTVTGRLGKSRHGYAAIAAAVLHLHAERARYFT